jgi:hypothetical protein
MQADIATIRALFPDLATVPDATVQAFLDDAIDTVAAGSWGRCLVKAQLYYAAHHCALFKGRMSATGIQGAGPIQSASAEGLSVSFAIPSGRGEAQSWWGQTPHGTAYMALQRQCLSRGGLSW